MLPPQAPPAHVTHANQSAIDAIQRMQDTQRWIAAQQSALPDLPAMLDEPGTFLDELDAFWKASVEHGPGTAYVPRWQALALHMAQIARDDATLRRNDGTLAGDAAALAGGIARHPGGPLPGDLRAHELLVGTQPYAGALVVLSDTHPGQVLLFTVDAGWHAFDSLDALYRDVELRMRARLAHSDDLPGVGMDDIEAVIDTHFVGSRLIDGDVFETLAHRLVARQREKAALTWKLTATPGERNDALRSALDLHALLDVHAIVQQRDLALAARMEEERLAIQPAKVREHWRQAANAYRDSWREAKKSDLAAPPLLASFATDVLATELAKAGIDAEPGELRVRLTRRVPEKPVANLLSGFPSEDLSLLQLAYRNVGALQTDALTVIHADGSVREDVPAERLRSIVRELDLPRRYVRHLDEVFGHSPEATARRSAVTRLQQARMRFEAADARLSFLDPKEPRSFLDDRLERGFEWVKAVLDHPAPAGRARVEGHEIVVHQLTYKGAPLGDVFTISARQRKAVDNIVVYTPDAPDGVAFREFHDRAEFVRNFLLAPAFEGYLLERLPIEFSEVSPRGKLRFKTLRLNDDRTLGWIFGGNACQGCTEMDARFEEREVTASFLDAAYDSAVGRAKRNATHLARSTDSATRQDIGDIYLWTNLPSLLLQEFVVHTVQSFPRAAQAAWRFYDNVKAGDSTRAFLDFTDGYTQALGVLPLYTSIPRLAGASVRLAPGSRTLVPTRHVITRPEALFEERYLAQGMAVPPGKPQASGVYTIGGQSYIAQGGKMYHVNFDADIAGWRLSKPHSPASLKTGGPVERLADGSWQYRSVGLQGGGFGRGVAGSRLAHQALHEDPVAILADSDLLNPEVARLSMHQRSVAIDALYQRLPVSEYARTLKHMLGSRPKPTRLSASQRQAWDDALQAGTWAPADPPAGSLRLAAGPAAPPRVEAVPFEWWPEHVYAYLPGQIGAHGTEMASITLQELRVFRGLHVGIPVTTLPPTSPLSSLPPGLAAWLPYRAGNAAGATLGSASGEWVRINLKTLQQASQTTARRSYRLARVGQTDAYLLRPNTRALLQADISRGDAVRFFGNEFEFGGGTP